jgi:bacteriocin biosynthesis cyclodehydratase domain-containing protein
MDSPGAPLIGFKRHVRTETTRGATYLISARGTTALSGTSVDSIVPLLDGTHNLAEILAEMSPELSAGQVGQVLGRLTEANLIGYRDPSSPGDGGPLPGNGDAAAEAYWDLAGLDGENVTSGATDKSVEIVALGWPDVHEAADASLASGLAVRETGGAPASFSLVLCEDYLDPGLEEVNRRHLAEGRPWLLAKPVGADPWVGPVFQPGAGPCWSCLAQRLHGHRRSEASIQRLLRRREPIRPPEASLPAGRTLGLQTAILEAAKWLAGVRYEGQDAVWILDTITLNSGLHPVHRRPQCRACGDPGLVASQVRKPVAPVSRAKAADTTGGHRARSSEQMLQRYGSLVDPVTGVVAEIRRAPGSPSPTPCCLSGPNLALTDDNPSGIRAGLRTQSGGKGVTELDAQVSALCEAVERYCGSRMGDEPTVRGSFRALREDAVHPDTFQLFHQRQFRDRARWNKTCAAFQHVPEPFNDDMVIEWTPVWSLTTHRQRMLPTQALYFDVNSGDTLASVRADSNGNAAGSSLEDAILQGFFELVERDAVALWWYNRTRQPEVDLQSFEDEFDDSRIGRIHQAYTRMNRQVWVLDLTSDLSIPAMAAISRRTDKPAEDIMLGFGAHFDPRVALSRALTELGQMLPPVIDARADGGGYSTLDPHLRHWWAHATVNNQPYLAPDARRASCGIDDYDYVPQADLRNDIDSVCALTQRSGLDLLVLDQTRPDIGLPVVKVIVPGLRHFWARFASGRLYEVPVRLGRLSTPTPYENLNPIPLFL